MQKDPWFLYTALLRIEIYLPMKLRKKAKIRKRYYQVPHLTQDTAWESYKNTINITNKSQEVSPFPAGDHKAVMNRRKSMRNTRHKNTNDPQKKYRLGTVSKNILLEDLTQSLVLIPIFVFVLRSRHNINMNNIKLKWQ